ncbi:MAG: glutamate--tRNA ligase [Sphingomonadales bacterium]|nr:glutamate--tRNA ligase [Sphingomonadales bacterium]
MGNIRTALLNWLFAAKAGGTFLLRLDDTDRERSTEENAEGIRRDLAWLGLNWAREERQSARMDRYAAAAEALKAGGRLYACHETEEELDRKRQRRRARGLPPIYDRAALKLTDAERAALEAEGRRPHWRFRLANSEPNKPLEPVPTLIGWMDLVRGDQSVDIGSLSDPVLIRADGTPLYTFTSVVDDIDFAVTHIIRGEDHVTNTGVQIQLFEAFGAVPPQFAHHSLLVGGDGQALSKRLGALSVESFRDMDLEPMAVASHAALVGTSDAIAPRAKLSELVETFDLGKLSRSPGRFDVAELKALNAKLLHHLPYAAVADRLKAVGASGGEAFWEAVRGNLEVFADVRKWWNVVAGPVTPVVEDAAFASRAADLLPPEPWDASTWGAWTDAVKAATGTRGRALFHPLRLALTGEEAGPELKALLPLMGRTRAFERLNGRTG